MKEHMVPPTFPFENISEPLLSGKKRKISSYGQDHLVLTKNSKLNCPTGVIPNFFILLDHTHTGLF